MRNGAPAAPGLTSYWLRLTLPRRTPFLYSATYPWDQPDVAWASTTSVTIIQLPITFVSWKYAPEPIPPSRLNTYADTRFGRGGDSVLMNDNIRRSCSCPRAMPFRSRWPYPVPASRGSCLAVALARGPPVRQPVSVMDRAFEEG